MAASGKDAQTVYRNREGRRIDREEWVEQQQKKKKKRAADYPEQDGFVSICGWFVMICRYTSMNLCHV